MSHEMFSSYVAPEQEAVPSGVELQPPCAAPRFWGVPFPLCVTPDANVNHRAYDITQSHHAPNPGWRALQKPTAAATAPDAPAIHVSKPKASAVLASEPASHDVDPSGLSPAALMSQTFIGPAGLAALAVSHFGLQAIVEGIRDVPAYILDRVHQSGGMMGVQCHLKQQGIGRFGGMLLFELTPTDESTAERKYIVTVPIGGSLHNPLGPGAASYRYSWSNSSDREGHNYSVSSEADVKDSQGKRHRFGGGFGDSKFQGETFSFWKEGVFGFDVGPQLFRTDINKSLKVLGTGTEVQCGIAVMGTGPVAGLLGDPLFRAVRRMAEPARRTKERVDSNRMEHPHEATFLEALASIYLN